MNDTPDRIRGVLREVNAPHETLTDPWIGNKVKSNSFSVICTTKYSKHSREIKDVIKKHWQILTSDPVCARLFSDPLLFSHYRAKNIRDYLVKSDTFAGQ